MNESIPGAAPRVRSKAPRKVGPVWWALGFGGLTTAGLAGFTWLLLIMHALGYGVAAVTAPEAGFGGPDGSRYGLAFAVGAIVNLAGAATLTRMAVRSGIGTWPPVAQGLGAALAAAIAASCALLLTLGINPVDFLL